MSDRFKFRVWCNREKCYLYNAEMNNAIVLTQLPDYKIAEQCTGLKDKNGKLIYESDIVKSDSDSIYYIKWDKKTSSFREEKSNLPDMAYKAGHHLSLCADIYCKSYTIIGNIHENADLLGEKK